MAKVILELEMPESCRECPFYKITDICDILSAQDEGKSSRWVQEKMRQKNMKADRKTGGTRIKIRVPFSFGRGGSMALDMHDIGKFFSKKT